MEIKHNPQNNKEALALANLCKALIAKGFNLASYGFFDKNRHSCNVYLWLEDCPIIPFCAENSTKVEWCYSCGNCGEEIIGTYAVCMAAHKYEQKHDKCKACESN